MIPSISELSGFMRKLIKYSLSTSPEALLFWRPDLFQAAGSMRMLGALLILVFLMAAVDIAQYADELEDEVKGLKEKVAQLESKNQPNRSSDSGNGIVPKPETIRQGGGLSYFTCTDEKCNSASK